MALPRCTCPPTAALAEEPLPEAPVEEEPPVPPADEPAATLASPAVEVEEAQEQEAVPPTQEEPGGAA